VKLSKKNQILILSLSIVVLALIVLRMTGVFPQVGDDVAGTIGNVEKVDRFRGQQMKMEDIKCDDPEVAKFVQSAGFQNMMKDDNFRAILANPAQLKLVPMAVEVSQLVDQAAQDFHSFLEKGDNAKFWFGSAEYQQFYQSHSDVSGVLFPLPGTIIPLAIPDIQKCFTNSDFQKFVANFDFKAIYNQDIQGIFGSDIVKFFSNDFQSIVPMNIDFNSSEFQKLVFSQDFQKLVLSQDFQKWWSQDFQQMVANEAFNTLICSQEFQNVLNWSFR